MSFVIYNIHNTRILCDRPSWQRQDYASKGAATAAMNRIEKKLKAEPNCYMASWDVFEGKPFDRTVFAVAEYVEFFEKIELKVTKKNLMGGGEFQIGVNAPGFMDPSTESYHCM